MEQATEPPAEARGPSWSRAIPKRMETDAAGAECQFPEKPEAQPPILDVLSSAGLRTGAPTLLVPYDHSIDERREIIIGHSAGSRLLAVCFSSRADTVRIFSARKATPRERRDYEEGTQE
jgi:uncharacterized DUF497 family protein